MWFMITESFKVWLGSHRSRSIACSGVHVTTIGAVKSSTITGLTFYSKMKRFLKTGHVSKISRLQL